MSERLTLQDLVDLLSDKQGITKKDAETFIRELVDLTTETISQKDFVRVKDFGTFKLTPVKARKSVDVNTGESIEISAHYRLGFTPDKVLREAVNRPFAHFESIIVEEETVFEEKKKEPIKKNVTTPPQIEKHEIEDVVPTKEETVDVEPIAEEQNLPIAEVVEEVVSELEVEKQEEHKEILVETIEDKIETFLPQEEIEEVVEVIEDAEEQIPPVDVVESNSIEAKPIEPKVEFSVEDKDDEEEDQYWIDYEALQKEKKKKNMRIGIALMLVALIAIGYWGYTKYFAYDEFSVPVAQNNSNIIISDTENVTEESDPSDSTVDQGQTEEENAESISSTPAEPYYIEVKERETMRKLGTEHYGYDAFWVYIFEENREIIKRPDEIQAGMKLKIAPRSKYGIDPNDKESIRKAQILQYKLFAEFEKDGE